MKKQFCWYSFFTFIIILTLNSTCSAGEKNNVGFVGFNKASDQQIFFAKLESSENSQDEDDMLLDEFDEPEASEPVSDPLYYFNYAMYSFNDFMYHYALEPITSGYETITPRTVRKGVSNFFHNLLFPVRFVNNLLQGEIVDAALEVEIFLINSTVGVLGLAQVAQEGLDIKTNDEDLGQTFGKWGVGNGCYVVWPFLGPSTLRDTLGDVGDSFLKPLNYVEPWELSLGLQAYEKVNTLSFHLGEYESLKKAALDPYVAIRDAYIQNRASKVKE